MLTLVLVTVKPHKVASDFLGRSPDAIRKVHERSSELLLFLQGELARVAVSVHLVEPLIEPRHRLLEIVAGYVPPTDIQVDVTKC